MAKGKKGVGARGAPRGGLQERPRNAVSSMDVARAAAAKLAAQRPQPATEDGRVVKRSYVGFADPLEAVYTVHTASSPAALVVAHVGSVEAASALVASLKSLKVDACAAHARTAKQAAKWAADRDVGVLVACDARIVEGALLGGKPRTPPRKRRVVAIFDGGEERIRTAVRAGSHYDEVVEYGSGTAWSPEYAAVRETVRRRCGALRKLQRAAAAAVDEEHGAEDKRQRIADARANLEVAVAATTVQGGKAMRRKLAALGMLRAERASRGGDDPEADVSTTTPRDLALTRWLDGSTAGLRAPVASCWRSKATVRSGAACCAASRCIRARLFDYAHNNIRLGGTWAPNPAGGDDWGGAFGKACGHNEVVMHCLRPFAPLEVLNTRCCSRAAPAPGNAGFDGCLEFLQAQCERKHRATTVWDVDRFIFISACGTVEAVEKRSLLERSSAGRLVFLVPALRRATLACGGRASATDLIRLIDALVAAAATNGRLRAIRPRRTLDAAATRLICAFTLGPADFAALYADTPPADRRASGF